MSAPQAGALFGGPAQAVASQADEVARPGAEPRADGPPGGGGPPSLDEFAAMARGVEVAAREWGVQPGSPEARFVSAMLGTASWLARLGAASQAQIAATVEAGRKIAEDEAARARSLSKAAQTALDQARSAQIALQVEQETVVARMMVDTLPVFAKQLGGALVIREKRWNARARLRGYAAVVGMTLAVFGGGYASRAWQDDGLTTGVAVAVLGDCLAHPLEAKGRLYCDVTRVARPELR